MDPAVHLAARLFLAGLLAAAAAHKLRDRASFAAALADYAILPPASVRAGAIVLPFVELSLAAALLLRLDHAAPVLGVALLLAVYTAAIAVNLSRGRSHIDCGCLGPAALRAPLGADLVVRNLALVALALLAALPAGDRALTAVDAASVAGVLSAGALLLAGFETARGNRFRLRQRADHA